MTSYTFDYVAMLYRKDDATVYFKCAHFISNGLQGLSLLLCFVLLRPDAVQKCFPDKFGAESEQRSSQQVSKKRRQKFGKDATYEVVSTSCSNNSRRTRNTCAASLPGTHGDVTSNVTSMQPRQRTTHTVNHDVITDEFTVSYAQEQRDAIARKYSCNPKHIDDSQERNCRTTKL